MLNHTVFGPDESGEFHAAYATAGFSELTSVRLCRTRQQAEAEAARLNADQIASENLGRHVGSGNRSALRPK